MAKIILTRGIPASGKSEWAKAWVAESPETRMRLNRDDTRLSMFGKLWGLTAQQEAMITRFHMDAARHALAKGHDVVVDATHLLAWQVTPWFRVGPVEFRDFPIDLQTAIYRDRSREKKVGEAVIRKMASRVNKDGSLKPPPTQHDSREYQKYVPTPALPSAFVFDIDGTLASIPEGGRSPYDYDRVHEDVPIKHVVDMLKRLAPRHAIVLLSGRDDACRAQTAEWLAVTGITPDRLYMRATGDKRDDAIVKHELFHNYIATNFNVLGMFDDRLRVRRMWHAIDVPLFSIGDPDADF